MPTSAPYHKFAPSNKNTGAREKFCRHVPKFYYDLPLKFQFLNFFEIIVETSLIAYSIVIFIPKNIKTGDIVIKLTGEEI